MLLSLGFFGACTEGKPVIEIEAAQAVDSQMIVGSSSAFMRIRNLGNADDTLISAHPEIPGSFAELHDIVDGKMIKIDAIRIPKKAELLLRPVGPHLMLYKLPRNVTAGTMMYISLVFRKTGTIVVSVPVVKNYLNYKPAEN